MNKQNRGPAVAAFPRAVNFFTCVAYFVPADAFYPVSSPARGKEQHRANSQLPLKNHSALSADNDSTIPPLPKQPCRAVPPLRKVQIEVPSRSGSLCASTWRICGSGVGNQQCWRCFPSLRRRAVAGEMAWLEWNRPRLAVDVPLRLLFVVFDVLSGDYLLYWDRPICCICLGQFIVLIGNYLFGSWVIKDQFVVIDICSVTICISCCLCSASVG
jgi:hypothetical protein